MAKSVCVLLLSVIGLIISIPLQAQAYLVHHYTEQDGLPSAEVNDITQDQWGRLWFATRSGIAAYDGVSWERFSTVDGLRGSSYIKIQADSRGKIWAVAPGVPGGIVVTFHDIGKENSHKSWGNIPGPKGNLLTSVDITSFQLYEPNGDPNKRILAIGTLKHGLLLLEKNQWHHFTESSGLISNCIYGIALLKERLYLATEKGLIKITLSDQLQINNTMNHTLELPTAEVLGIGIQQCDQYPDSQSKQPKIWLSGKQWLGYFQENTNGMTYFPVDLLLSKGSKREDKIIQLQPDYRCGLYVSNKVSINYFNYHTLTWEVLSVKNGLITDGANSVDVDFEKNVWISSRRGVSKISSRRFTTFKMNHGLLEDEVSSILEYKPGKFVLGHNHGVTLYDSVKKHFQAISMYQEEGTGRPVSRVLEMQLDSGGNIWMAMGGAGVVKLNPQLPGQWSAFGPEQGVPGNAISIWVDTSPPGGDRIWVLSSGKLYLHSPANQTQKPFTQKPIPFYSTRNTFKRIYGNNGSLRFITSHQDGVFVNQGIDDTGKEVWQNYRNPDEPNANNVYTLLKGNQGKIFAGTLGGLYILTDRSLMKFKTGDFSVNRPVYFIIEDSKNRLWIGTDNGVIRWDGIEKRVYTTAEGLVGHETNRSAVIIDSKGQPWFGTNGGVSIYHEGFDNNFHFNPPPKIRFLWLQTPNRSISIKANRAIHLDNEDNSLEFHFQGISFLDEHALRFVFRMEGLEDKWSGEKYYHEQAIGFANLSPGKYQFHLKAVNALGAWSQEISSPEIIISQPIFKRWWFFIGIVLLIGLISYAIFRFFSEKQHSALLEKKVVERSDQLQKLEKQYRCLFEESKDVVFMSKPSGRIIDINPAGVQFFEANSKEELVGEENILRFYQNPADREEFKAEIERNGYVKDFEINFKLKNDRIINSVITATLVRDKDSNIDSYRGIIRDITRQKVLEQQLNQAQKMEAIGTLAGGIAHDFNNIMGVIVWNMELMRDELPEGDSGESLKSKIEHVLNAADRGTELVKQILTFSQQGRQERVPVKLSTYIKDSLKLLRSTLPATIEIRQDVREDTGFVLADSPEIHQIMMNLGTNAAHAMREKGGILEVNLEEVEMENDFIDKSRKIEPGIYLKLTVSDTGHGMSPEVMKRIFEPYFTTKKTGEGTGMGLALTHGIVKSLGGDIQVTSQPGVGTEFLVVLPRYTGEVKTESVKRTEEVQFKGTERILIVDDEVELVESGARLLKRMGYHVTGETDPRKALSLFKGKANDFDLVITDLTMPYMTGVQFAEHIKDINPAIPVILLSGFSQNTSSEKIDNSIIADFLIKPINKNDLARVIRHTLDNYSTNSN